MSGPPPPTDFSRSAREKGHQTRTKYTTRTYIGGQQTAAESLP